MKSGYYYYYYKIINNKKSVIYSPTFIQLISQKSYCQIKQIHCVYIQQIGTKDKVTHLMLLKPQVSY